MTSSRSGLSPSEQLQRRRSEWLDKARVASFSVNDEFLTVTLSDGRVLSTPLDWYPRLVHATPAERARGRIEGDGHAIWWDDIDDGVEVAHLLVGWQGGESERSFNRWLEERRAKRKVG